MSDHSMRTPLGRVRGLGSAKEGVHHWWVQRLTAIALVPLTIWFVASVASMAGADHATVIAWVASPLVAIALCLLIITTFYHAALGLQVVIEDYVAHEGGRLAWLVVQKFVCFVLAAIGLFAVLKIAFGG